MPNGIGYVPFSRFWITLRNGHLSTVEMRSTLKKQWLMALGVIVPLVAIYCVDRFSTFGIYNYARGFREFDDDQALVELGFALTAIELDLPDDSLISVRAAVDGDQDTIWIRAQLAADSAESVCDRLDVTARERQWRQVLKRIAQARSAPVRWWDTQDGLLFNLYYSDRPAPVGGKRYNYKMRVDVDLGCNILFIEASR